MKKTALALAAEGLKNWLVVRYLEHYKSSDTSGLIEALNENLCSKKVIAAAVELAVLRENDSQVYNDLVTSHQTYIVKKKANEFSDFLVYLQKVLDGEDFIFNNEPINPKLLAKKILTPFSTQKDALQKTTTEFSIGDYRMTVEFGLANDQYQAPYRDIKLFHKDDMIGEDKASVLTTWSEATLPVSFQKFVECINNCLETFGCKRALTTYMGHPTFLARILGIKSQEEGKTMPSYFGNQDGIKSLVDTGNLKELRTLLEKEYEVQQKSILPAAMEVVYGYGERLIERCQTRQRLLNNRIPILKKIQDGTVGGWFNTRRVPLVEGVAQNKKQVFVLAYRDHYQLGLIVQVLAQAGWGGSLVIASDNFPSVTEILRCRGQVDYLIQSDLGHSHDKDLWKEELEHISYLTLWKGKVLKCEIYSNEKVNVYAEWFTKDKIFDKHYDYKVK